MKNTEVNIDAPALGCKIGRAYQIMLGQLVSALKEVGLNITTSEYLVLRAVYAREGLQQCEIVDMVGKDKAAVCRCVAGMVKKELLSVQPVSHKCLRVYLTEKSRRMKAKIMEVASIRHKALEDITTPGELEIFTNILENIIKSR